MSDVTETFYSATDAIVGYGTQWLIGDGASPETFRFDQMLDRETNTLKSIVERTYVLGYSCCCLYAVPISVGGDITGAPLSAF